MQQQVAQGVSPKRELQSEVPRGEERSPQARGEGSPFNMLSKEAAGTQSQLLNHDIFHSFGG
jgi:hypothetical protein